jgi:hypothetical protein
MPCFFQDCGFAPDGGAPASWTWPAAWRGVVSRNDPPRGAHGTSSKMRSCFSPWERLPTEPANRIGLVRGTVSCQVVSHRLLEVETHQAVRRYGLQPSKAALALPLKRHGLRRAIYVKYGPAPWQVAHAFSCIVSAGQGVLQPPRPPASALPYRSSCHLAASPLCKARALPHARLDSPPGYVTPSRTTYRRRTHRVSGPRATSGRPFHADHYSPAGHTPCVLQPDGRAEMDKEQPRRKEAASVCVECS